MHKRLKRWFPIRTRKGAWVALVLAILVTTAIYAVHGALARSFEAEAARLADLLELEPGMRVGEIGAGSGEMALQMARRVGPTGHVFTNELDPERLSDIREVVLDAGLENVTIVEGSENDANLPEDCCDAIFMRRVYHHFSAPQKMNASLLEALRPEGTLAIIDFSPEDAIFFVRWFAGIPEGVPQDRGGHGISQKIVTEEMTQAGFRPERVIEDWIGSRFFPHYCVLFRRQDLKVIQPRQRDVQHHEAAFAPQRPFKLPPAVVFVPDCT